MKFRIKEYEKGFLVEIEKRNWFGKKYWNHFISVAGIESQPFYFSTFESAIKELLNEVRYQTIVNSKDKMI